MGFPIDMEYSCTEQSKIVFKQFQRLEKAMNATLKLLQNHNKTRNVSIASKATLKANYDKHG